MTGSASCSARDFRWPDITEFARTYLGVDPVKELVPVYPTCHYLMGGIPTTVHGQVLLDNTTVVPGLYAAGECACVSVHGANRLGTNSLLDINVFGRRAGIAAANYAIGHDFVDMPPNAAAMVVGWVGDILSEHGNERVADIRTALQQSMDINAAPEGAVMVTLKIARFDPENPDMRAGRASGCRPCPRIGCSTCC